MVIRRRWLRAALVALVPSIVVAAGCRGILGIGDPEIVGAPDGSPDGAGVAHGDAGHEAGSGASSGATGKTSGSGGTSSTSGLTSSTTSGSGTSAMTTSRGSPSSSATGSTTTTTSSSTASIFPPDAAVPLTAATFPGLVIRAYCEQLAVCCDGDAAYPGVDVLHCITNLVETDTVPFTAIGLAYPGLGSPYAVLDSAKAEACIAGVSGLLGCGFVSDTALAGLASTCAAAYVPQLEAGGAGCLTSFDCAPGTYCGPIAEDNPVGIPLVAAGGGTCLPLNALSSPCAEALYSSDCTYQGGPTQQAYCDTTGYVCQSSEGLGKACTTDEGCLSGQCHLPDGGMATCVATGSFVAPYGVDYCLRYMN